MDYRWVFLSFTGFPNYTNDLSEIPPANLLHCNWNNIFTDFIPVLPSGIFGMGDDTGGISNCSVYLLHA